MTMPLTIDNAINEHITRFMKHQTVMSIATSQGGQPHCAMCFYVFAEELNAIVFKSKPTTSHVLQGLANPAVAGTILPDKLNPGKTSGIQFEGTFRQPEGAERELAAKQYYNKYPFAAVVPGEIWMVKLERIVFTDATLGMGKKRHWEKTPATTE